MQKVVLFIFFVFAMIGSSAQILVKEVRCEYRENPLGIDNPRPTLQWILQSSRRNCLQAAYRLLVADDSALLAKNIGNVWDTQKMNSATSIQVSYTGRVLKAAKTYYWKVMVWNNFGEASAWSKPAKWQMGLLTHADWKGAQWIGYDKIPDSLHIVPALNDPGDKRWSTGKDILPLMRKEFDLNKSIKKATIFLTGLGQFELNINGKKVGDHFMDPGWTQYSKHALYVTFDVTGRLQKGSNVIGVMLGNGFYFVPGERYRKLKGAFGYPKMICRTLIQYTDGSEQNIVSDASWKTAPGPVTFSSIYGGEDYNATLAQAGWDMPGFNTRKFKKAVVVDGPPVLEAQPEEPLKILDQFGVQKVTHPKPGVWVYDMGQNASGIPFIAVKGKRGAIVKLSPAELLDDKGLILQDPVGKPVYFNYTLKGEGVEKWHPHFMYYGFRYIQVEGAVPAGENNKDDLPVTTEIKTLHTRNSAATIGSFSSSNQLFNQTFKLIDWAIKSNTSSIFTDCPHREKLGWLEEAHLVGSSIRYNYDIASLCRKIIKDMMNAQTEDGLIPDIAPEYTQFGGPFRDSPEWGSNGIIMPFYVYQWYGDKQVLEESYHMMARYAAYLEKKSENHILYFGLGDWYDIGPRDLGPSQQTPSGITSTAIYYYDLTILTKIAGILGKTADEKTYRKLAVEVREAFNKTFYHAKTGQYGTGSQTANAMAVYMGLVKDADKSQVIDMLVKDIRAHNNSITAGDIGYRYLLRVLDDAGRSDIIYDMNNRSDVPGYGYQIAHGATSLTESWAGNRISSNNHFMLGHLMEWFYSGLGGIRADSSASAFKKIIIRPEVVGDVTDAKASIESPYGTISNNWHKNAGQFVMHVQIPVNTTAVIYLPADKNSKITESGNNISQLKDIKLLSYDNGKAMLAAGSGNYLFTVVP